MKVSTLIVFFVMVCVEVQSQTRPVYTQLYQYNYFTINPAFAGQGGQNFHSIVFGNSQHSTEAILSFDTKLNKIKSGLGLMGSSSRYGPALETNINLSYSYDNQITEKTHLIFGGRIGNTRLSYDEDSYRPVDPNDPLLQTGKNWTSNLVMGFGGLLKIDKFSFAVSSPDVIASSYSIFNQTVEPYRVIDVISVYSYNLKEWGKMEHSIYSPIVAGEFGRIDFNSVIIVRKKYIAGFTLEISEGDFMPKLNAGMNVKDFAQVIVLLYSRRDRYEEAKFAGAISVRLLLNN